MSKNDGGPAFPAPICASDWMCGMTLRDYFAAKAMQGYCASIGVVSSSAPTDADIARYSYDMADVMLAERAKDQP